MQTKPSLGYLRYAASVCAICEFRKTRPYIFFHNINRLQKCITIFFVVSKLANRWSTWCKLLPPTDRYLWYQESILKITNVSVSKFQRSKGIKRQYQAGCTPQTLTFFASYMRNRHQVIDRSGQWSEPYVTRSGVSQGSNLGLLEFI